MPETTDSFAKKIGLKPASVRAACARTGSYFGITPIKLPNGRLLWPDDAVERLTSGKKEVK